MSAKFRPMGIAWFDTHVWRFDFEPKRKNSEIKPPLVLHQGYHGEFQPDKAQYSVRGIICPLFWIGLNDTQNLGKARALEALVAVEPLYIVTFFCKK